MATQAVEDRPAQYVGARVPRVEDPRYLKGRGKFVDDIQLPGMLHAAFARSPYAHARIVSIDALAALERPGVHAVFTGQDMADLAQPLPCAWVPPGVEMKAPAHWPLARDEVRHVGDPVAVAVAEAAVCASTDAGSSVSTSNVKAMRFNMAELYWTLRV